MLFVSTLIMMMACSSPPEEFEPTFKSEEAKASFVEAKKLFDAGSWTEADKIFEQIQSETNNRGQATLRLWRRACRVGPKLVEIEKMPLGKKWPAALQKITAFETKYRDTPLRDRILRAYEKVEKAGFVLVVPFEESDKGSSGRKLVKNKKLVKRGESSLQVPGARGFNTATLVQFDAGLLSDARALDFWIHPAGQKVEFFLTLSPTGMGVSTMTDSRGNVTRYVHGPGRYRKVTVSGRKWKHVAFDLRKDFTVNQGSPLADAKVIQLYCFDEEKPVVIDHLRLMKR